MRPGPAWAAALVLGWALAAQPARAEDPQQVETRFVAALEAIDAGQPRAAIPALRGILATDPSLVRVRLELARAYFEADQLALARREFLTVLSGDIPPPVRRAVLGYMRAIDARRGWSWSLELGAELAPGSGRDYDTDTVEIEVLGQTLPFTIERPDPPHGRLLLRADAQVQKPVGSGLLGARSLGFVAGGVRLGEAPGTRHDDQAVSAQAGLRLSWPQAVASIGPAVTLRGSEGARDEDLYLLEGRGEVHTAAGLAVFATAAGGRVNAHRGPDGDGTVLRGSLGVIRSLAGSALVGASVYFEDRRAEAAHAGYRGLGLELLAEADIPGGFTIGTRLWIEDQWNNAADPVFGEAMDERGAGGSLRLTRNDVFVAGAFVPFLELQLARRSSAIDAFSYTDRRMVLGFRKDI